MSYRFTALITIITAIVGGILFIPIYLVSPTFDLNSITAYYLAGFIFVEVLLFLSIDSKGRETSHRFKLPWNEFFLRRTFWP
jgi:hypothetical protein